MGCLGYALIIFLHIIKDDEWHHLLGRGYFIFNVRFGDIQKRDGSTHPLHRACHYPKPVYGILSKYWMIGVRVKLMILLNRLCDCEKKVGWWIFPWYLIKRISTGGGIFNICFGDFRIVGAIFYVWSGNIELRGWGHPYPIHPKWRGTSWRLNDGSGSGGTNIFNLEYLH